MPFQRDVRDATINGVSASAGHTASRVGSPDGRADGRIGSADGHGDARPGTPALDVDALHVPFGPHGNAGGLIDLTLQVAAGERVAMLGPSGEGKTTFLRAIAGLAPVTSGRVRIRERDVTALPAEQRGAVYLHQEPVLFPHLSVAQNVAFPLVVRGVARREWEPQVQALLGRLGVGELARRSPEALSGGQRHRVALARALAARPHVLLLDEPLSALDPGLRREVREAIREAHSDSGAALLLVTHDLDDATALGDRIAVLLGGTLAQLAPAAELFARPASLAVMRFLGVHAELEGVHCGDGRVECALGTLVLPTDVAAAVRCTARVMLGVRTDALRCVADRSDGAPRGVVRSVQLRPRGSSATIQLGEVVVEALIDAVRPPAVGAAVSLQVDSRGVTAFAHG